MSENSFPEQTEPLFGPYGTAALIHAGRFATNGANAAWFHMFDAEAFERCARYSIQPCVEFKTFRADFAKRPDLCPIGIDGKPIRFGALVQGVCLSQTEFLEETEAALNEGVRTFHPRGVWLDYLTYSGWFETPNPDLQESCFCRKCVADFCRATGIDAERPDRILADFGEAWKRHKCERIAAFARRYTETIRQAIPGCVVGAYMCPWRPDELDGALTRIFAQDYRLLADYINIFTPLIYVAKSGRSADWGLEWLEKSETFVAPEHATRDAEIATSNPDPAPKRTGNGPYVQLILDALDFPDSLLAASRSTRRPSFGLQIFGGAEIFADSSRAKIFSVSVDRIRSSIG